MNALTLNLNTNLVQEEYTEINKDLLKGYERQMDTSNATKKTYLNCINKFLNWIDENNITYCTYETLIDYKNDLRMKYKTKALNTHLVAIKDFFKYLERKGFNNVAKGIKKERTSEEFSKDCLTLEQVKQILNSIDINTLNGARANALFRLLIGTGLRECEVVRADINDLTTKGNKNVLYVQGKGETQKNKYVVIDNSVMQALQHYLALRNATPGEPLFTSESDRNNGGRLTTRTIQRIVKGLFKENGIINERITTHSTRHTAITLSIIAGADVVKVQEMARHKSLNTTMIYIHDLDRLNNSAESKLDKLING